MKRAEKERVLLVDGYNILGAWPELTRGRALEQGREQLVEALRDYAGYTAQRVIVVFDAFKTGRRSRTTEELDGFSVVYTQKGETADHYIERTCALYAHQVEFGKAEVRVATSDMVEQTVVLGRGATRLSARELIEEMQRVRASGALHARTNGASAKSTLLDRVSPAIRARLEEMRRGGGTC